ncbi:antimicrobial peptide NK-lysin-like [Suricata suricatta]|uniref:antimicrobial peptide NK-lysin-like n=1 Tax=Suricata suricatta TaxID=37032 RepID=UPI0011559502|nr:antimicrobial peptide NK-lysin-like [Suricata suricatta]
MTSWALLLLASALLATPGLTFSGLTPEDHDLDMADRCQDEKFFWMLAQETPQHNASLNLCGTCRLILNWLKNRMGQCRIQIHHKRDPERETPQANLCETQDVLIYSRSLSPWGI